MREVFADTAYWVAVLNPKDKYHSKSKEVSNNLSNAVIVTTDEVLGETLNLLSTYRVGLPREVAVNMVNSILANPNVEVVPQTHQSFLEGINLYSRRLDKNYSIQDCISMNVCRVRQISEVLTSDHHFEQEGLIALLRNHG